LCDFVVFNTTTAYNVEQEFRRNRVNIEYKVNKYKILAKIFLYDPTCLP
jgi:hypothetical protein